MIYVCNPCFLIHCSFYYPIVCSNRLPDEICNAAKYVQDYPPNNQADCLTKSATLQNLFLSLWFYLRIIVLVVAHLTVSVTLIEVVPIRPH
jgi:hypothetical protein